MTILPVQCDRCDGYAVHVEAVCAEDEADLLEVEGVHLVIVLPVHVHNGYLCCQFIFMIQGQKCKRLITLFFPMELL